MIDSILNRIYDWPSLPWWIILILAVLVIVLLTGWFFYEKAHASDLDEDKVLRELWKE